MLHCDLLGNLGGGWNFLFPESNVVSIPEAVTTSIAKLKFPRVYVNVYNILYTKD
jgi:hypothetical protein